MHWLLKLSLIINNKMDKLKGKTPLLQDINNSVSNIYITNQSLHSEKENSFD